MSFIETFVCALTRARAGRRMLSLGASLILALAVAPAAPAWGADAPYRLKTVMPYPNDSTYQSGWDAVEFGGALYFLVDGGMQRELWKSDGTAAGTERIRTWRYSGLTPSGRGHLIAMNDALYFQAWDAAHGLELWKSDGTTTGTIPLADIFQGAEDSNPKSLTVAGGKLFFAANDGVTGEELWMSDGTAAGTAQVSDIVPGAEGSMIMGLAAFNGLAFFAAHGSDFFDLFKSDGTGATPVKGDSISGILQAFNPTVVNGALYFHGAIPGGMANGLWKSDGTANGTVFVKDPSNGNAEVDPHSFTGVNGKVFFVMDAPETGDELWITDGTRSGTTLVKDICSGSPGSFPQSLLNVNGMLLFRANDGVHGYALWKSDGTAFGTVMVKDLFPQESHADNITHMINAWGTLGFVVDPPFSGPELWKSNGAASGTVRIGAVGADGLYTMVTGIKCHKNRIFMLVSSQNNSQELWVCEQTAVPVEMSTFAAE